MARWRYTLPLDVLNRQLDDILVFTARRPELDTVPRLGWPALRATAELELARGRAAATELLLVEVAVRASREAQARWKQELEGRLAELRAELLALGPAHPDVPALRAALPRSGRRGLASARTALATLVGAFSVTTDAFRADPWRSELVGDLTRRLAAADQLVWSGAALAGRSAAATAAGDDARRRIALFLSTLDRVWRRYPGLPHLPRVALDEHEAELGARRALRRPSADLGGSAAALGRSSTPLAGPSTSLDAPSATPDRPSAPLGRPSAALAPLSAELGASSAPLGRPSGPPGGSPERRGDPPERFGGPSEHRGGASEQDGSTAEGSGSPDEPGGEGCEPPGAPPELGGAPDERRGRTSERPGGLAARLRLDLEGGPDLELSLDLDPPEDP